MQREEIVGGFWDCVHCGSKHIDGDTKDCPTCGRPQGVNTHFYTAADSAVVDTTITPVSMNPDWTCSYCGSLNPDSNKGCDECNASREGDEQTYFENLAAVDTEPYDDIVEPESDPDVVTPPIHDDWWTPESAPKARFAWGGFIPKVGIFLMIGLLIGLTVYLLAPRDTQVSIDGREWSRSISIEEERTVQESDWDLPSGARLRYTQEAFYGTDQVADGTETKYRNIPCTHVTGYKDGAMTEEDLGNGKFKRTYEQIPSYAHAHDEEPYEVTKYKSVDVYKTKYYYDIDRWFYNRECTSSGTTDPYWAPVTLVAREREGSRSETYIIYFYDRGDKSESRRSQKVSFSEWQLCTDRRVFDATTNNAQLYSIKFQ